MSSVSVKIGWLLLLCTKMATSETINLAAATNKGLWIAHPTVGEASFDSLQRYVHNPVYVGKSPYEWPVNGVITRINATNFALYIGLYGRGYRGVPSEMLAMISTDGGKTWGNETVVLMGNKSLYDRGGGVPDGSVVYEDGVLHMVHDWGLPGSLGSNNGNGGLGYANSTKGPLGPFERSAVPLNAERNNTPISPGYRMVYGGSLIRRSSDWLIVSAMSTAGNAGGMWAMVAMSSPNPYGPYSAPKLIMWPQSGVWHPHPCEFYPAFSVGDYVYAPCTSLSANRNYQVLYYAQLEDALSPTAWKVYQDGSLWHWEGAEFEAAGIWGQTFSAFVENETGTMHIMYPSKDQSDVGTINVASRQWDAPYVDEGFWVSAPSADSLAIMWKTIPSSFTLNASVFDASSSSIAHKTRETNWTQIMHGVTGSSSGWTLRFNYRGDIGQSSGSYFAGMAPSPRCFHDTSAICFDGKGAYSIVHLFANGSVVYLNTGRVPEFKPQAPVNVTLMQVIQEELLHVTLILNNNVQDPIEVTMPRGVLGGGGVGVHATTGTALQVKQLNIAFDDEAPEQESFFLLPGDAMAGAGNGANVVAPGWELVNDIHFRAGYGYMHPGNRSYVLGKWSFIGTAATLWSPRGPSYGNVTIALDGDNVAALSLYHESNISSSPVYTWKQTDNTTDLRHALVITWTSGGAMVVDSLEYTPAYVK
eukprot:m.11272 g.11272  ORF g.11272 m.11272 type:complete len:702 (+) comp4411_c0_seq1:231-2336(+)